MKSALYPATLTIGETQWSIESSETLEVFTYSPDGRGEGDEGEMDLILVDHAAHRIVLCGAFDWWAFGEVIVNLMRRD